jgi:DNA-binding NarL/FixJ family response regulator
VTSVLIIDNHEGFSKGLQTYVRDQLGCTVTGLGGDAAAGLELARETRPDFALIDIGLPDESGLALARLLGNRYPEIRVVLMHDDESAEYVEAANGVGAMAYLPKVALSKRLPALLGKS